MKARLVINEIKQDVESSGFGPLGIGKIATFDPLIQMLKDLEGQKFWITWGDIGEPAFEEEFKIRYKTDGRSHTAYVEAESTDGTDVYMKYDEAGRKVEYKTGGNISMYNDAEIFFKIYEDEQEIAISFEQEMKENLLTGGFRVYND